MTAFTSKQVQKMIEVMDEETAKLCLRTIYLSTEDPELKTMIEVWAELGEGVARQLKMVKGE